MFPTTFFWYQNFQNLVSFHNNQLFCRHFFQKNLKAFRSYSLIWHFQNSVATQKIVQKPKQQTVADNIDGMSFNSNKVHFLLNKFLWKVVELFKSIFKRILVKTRHKKSNMSETRNGQLWHCWPINKLSTTSKNCQNLHYCDDFQTRFDEKSQKSPII